MDANLWDERYRARQRAEEDFGSLPAKLMVDTANRLRPGKALDLACGTGRSALWLAEHGWRVTAVDGSPTAINVLRQRASERNASVDTIVADLEAGQYAIPAATWDLIVICYYLQRDLLEPAMAGIVPGGLLLSIAHITGPGEETTKARLRPGELATYFSGWDILHSYEGKPHDSNHQRPVAEIVARRPTDADTLKTRE
jgi:tellurite methyltransferase